MVGMLIRSADVCASYRLPLQSAHLSHTPNVKLIEHTCLLLRVATLRARGVVEMDVLHLQVPKKHSETPMDAILCSGLLVIKHSPRSSLYLSCTQSQELIFKYLLSVH
jgi:hypothetical protein